MEKKLNKGRVIITIISLLLILVLLMLSIIFYRLSPVNKNKQDVNFEIKEGSTVSDVLVDLKKEKLIRSTFLAKVYTKIQGTNFLAGNVILNDKDSTIKIIDNINNNIDSNAKTVSLTFKEGFNINTFIEIVTLNTNIKKEDIINKLKDRDYLNKLIKDYWFLTDDILKEDIKYSLEGYLFPNTYNVYIDSDITDIFKILLDETDKVLKPYRKDIEKSKYSIHELMTMASLVEKEAILNEDRGLVAGVFYNRYNIDMKFESCATLGYALGEEKLHYTYDDMDLDSAYNTYKNEGFMPGPISNPSKESIMASIYPEDSEYFYFLSPVDDNSDKKTYFAKTYKEHEENINKYLR